MECLGAGLRAHLLQRGRAELDGDVVELLVLLRAKIAHDVGVLVRLPQQLDLPVHQVEALRQQALHSHIAAVKPAPGVGERGCELCCL